MSKKVQLTIADPCHENWDDMTPAEKGRFCASCQKQVIDFTNMSDSQIAIFFKKPAETLSKDGSVCGRFYSDQLDRDIEIPKKRIPWVKYFFQFALPAFLVSMKATAQGNVRARLVATTQTPPDCSRLTGRIDIHSIRSPQIKGIVLNEDSIPVPYASVVIKGIKQVVSADSAGIFKIERPESMKEIVLEISSVGYESKEMRLEANADLTKQVQVRLTAQMMGEVVVVGYTTTHTLRDMIAGAISTRRKKEVATIEKPKEEIPAMIKVYPNPVASGTNINVGCQKLKEGYYFIQLANQSGQQVMNKQAWIDGDTQVLNIDIPHVATGVYFLKLTNKETNKRFTQKIVIE